MTGTQSLPDRLRALSERLDIGVINAAADRIEELEETVAVLSDPETMAAIAEAEAES